MLMKQLVLTSLALACLMVIPLRTNACFCITPDVPAAFKQAKVVFLGEVIDIVDPKNASDAAPIQDRFFNIRFKVEKSWKGIPSGIREFNVLAAQGRYGCFAFPAVNKGERYLVYADPAYGAERWSVVTICNRTTAIRLGSNPRLTNPDAIDPYADIKMLDAITGRAFTFSNRRTQRGRV